MLNNGWRWVCRNWGTPSSLDGFCSGKSHLEMDDDWGYPHVWKPPNIPNNMDGRNPLIGFQLTIQDDTQNFSHAQYEWKHMDINDTVMNGKKYGYHTLWFNIILQYYWDSYLNNWQWLSCDSYWFWKAFQSQTSTCNGPATCPDRE